MKIKRNAVIAAVLCLFSELIYIGIMIFNLSNGLNYWRNSNDGFISDGLLLIVIMSVFSIAASVYVLLGAINTRKLLRALIMEIFYLVVLILSFDMIAQASGILYIHLYGGDVVPTSMGLFLPEMIFLPCIISLIFEARAYLMMRKQTRDK